MSFMVPMTVISILSVNQVPRPIHTHIFKFLVLLEEPLNIYRSESEWSQWIYYNRIIE